jgi:hypothetical protein
LSGIRTRGRRPYGATERPCCGSRTVNSVTTLSRQRLMIGPVSSHRPEAKRSNLSVAVESGKRWEASGISWSAGQMSPNVRTGRLKQGPDGERSGASEWPGYQPFDTLGAHRTAGLIKQRMAFAPCLAARRWSIRLRERMRSGYLWPRTVFASYERFWPIQTRSCSIFHAIFVRRAAINTGPTCGSTSSPATLRLRSFLRQCGDREAGHSHMHTDTRGSLKLATPRPRSPVLDSQSGKFRAAARRARLRRRVQPCLRPARRSRPNGRRGAFHPENGPGSQSCF